MIGSGALRELSNNPKYYTTLRNYIKKIPCPYEIQIDLDLKRTYPDDPICMSDDFQMKLKNILICYSVRNSSIGYCQGMNFIVARLLMIIENEENVFWIFTQIIEYLLPLNYYSELAGVIIDTKLICIYLEKYIPDLDQFFKITNFDLNVNNFIHKWLLSIFTQTLSIPLIYNFFDFFFLEGNIALFKGVLGIFASIKKYIFKSKDFETIYSSLSNQPFLIKNSDLLLYFLSKRKFQINESELNNYRNILHKSVIDSLISEGSLNNKKRKNSIHKISFKDQIKECNLKWPSCIYEMSNKDIIEILILKNEKIPYVIDNYYYEKTMTYPNEKENNIDEFFSSNELGLLIERQKHICENKKLIDTAFMLLEDKAISNNIDKSVKEKEEAKSDFYKKLEKSVDFETARNKVLKMINGKIISDKEIKGYNIEEEKNNKN
jgi:hypothetical protein